MLQTGLLQPLLVQLLEPNVLTDQICPPLSISFVSTKEKKPLLSCISKVARDNVLNLNSSSQQQQQQQQQQQNYENNSSNRINDNHTTFINHDENSPLLAGNNSNQTTTGNITSSNTNTNTNMNMNMNNDNDNTDTENTLIAKNRVEQLQKQIEELDDDYNTDYINANVNPVDNLNILSLMAIKNWNESTEKDKSEAWEVYSFGKYRLYMHEINSEYALLLCTLNNYPAAAAIGKLHNICKILSSKL